MLREINKVTCGKVTPRKKAVRKDEPSPIFDAITGSSEWI
jgi:hypothetical protein